jgi:antitoxin YefM
VPDSALATLLNSARSNDALVSSYFRDSGGALIHNQRVRWLDAPATGLLPFRPARQPALENLPTLLYIDVYKRTVMAELTISEARKALLDLPEKLARTPERAVTITRRGQPVLAILPWEFYESIIETLDILGDPEMVKALRESLEDLKRGRVVSNAEVKKRLGV